MEGDVVFGHGETVEVLQAFSELVSVPLPREQADCFLVVDPVGRGKVQLGLEPLLQRLLEAETVGVDPISVFLREDKGKGNEPLEFPRQSYSFWEAEHGEEGLIGSSLFGESFEQHGFEGLFEKSAHCMSILVLRL